MIIPKLSWLLNWLHWHYLCSHKRKTKTEISSLGYSCTYSLQLLPRILHLAPARRLSSAGHRSRSTTSRKLFVAAAYQPTRAVVPIVPHVFKISSRNYNYLRRVVLPWSRIRRFNQNPRIINSHDHRSANTNTSVDQAILFFFLSGPGQIHFRTNWAGAVLIARSSRNSFQIFFGS